MFEQFEKRSLYLGGLVGVGVLAHMAQWSTLFEPFEERCLCLLFDGCSFTTYSNKL